MICHSTQNLPVPTFLLGLQVLKKVKVGQTLTPDTSQGFLHMAEQGACGYEQVGGRGRALWSKPC